MRNHSKPQILVVEFTPESNGLERKLLDHGFAFPITSTNTTRALELLRAGGTYEAKRELALLLLPGPNIDAAIDFIALLRADDKLKRTILFVLLDTSDPNDLARVHDMHVAGCLDTQILEDEPEVFCNFLTRYLNIVKYPRRG